MLSVEPYFICTSPSAHNAIVTCVASVSPRKSFNRTALNAIWSCTPHSSTSQYVTSPNIVRTAYPFSKIVCWKACDSSSHTLLLPATRVGRAQVLHLRCCSPRILAVCCTAPGCYCVQTSVHNPLTAAHPASGLHTAAILAALPSAV